MRCVILQPSYVPWRGFFDQIYRADVFVFYDDVQYDRRGWRNRNQIKTPGGKQWLTIPVHARGSQTENRSIDTIEIAYVDDWQRSHRTKIEQAYAAAPFLGVYSDLLAELYGRRDAMLADYTIRTTELIARRLGIEHTKFLRSSGLNASGSKTDRLIDVLRKVGATHYISGPSARDYIESEKFEEAGITLEYMTYEYPEYPQLHPPFDPHVSILDLLFMTGERAGEYIWG